LQFAFAFARDNIRDVAVRLDDVNGPRGGRDMLCQILIDVPGRPMIVVRDVREDMYVAIDRAVKRAAYKIRQMVMHRRYSPRRLSRISFDTTNDPAGMDPATGE
jgi:ribosome-associated translation inhibitor RaiA